MQNPQDVQLAAQALESRLPASFRAAKEPPAAIILGTGLSEAAAELTQGFIKIPFSTLPNFPVSSVKSHTGAFACGLWHGLPLLVQLGRVHLYEGFSPAQVCMGLRLMAQAGCKTLIITNAAGALNPYFETPGLMNIADIINFTGQSSLSGVNHEAWGERFPDMSQPFDTDLSRLAHSAALKLGIRLENGVYIGVHGPEMETPAETRMYRQWGADAVGMSTALEVIAARHLGLRCLGISCLTNKNLPDCMRPAPLSEVIANAAKVAPKLARLLAAVLAELAPRQESA